MTPGIRAGLFIATLVSAFAFPWPVTALLSLSLALWVPLLPVSAGVLLEALYYAPGAHWFPLYTVFGALATFGAYLVRGKLKAGIIS